MGQSPAVKAHHARISSTPSNPFAGPSTPSKGFGGGGGGGGSSSAKKSEGTPAKEWNFTYLPPSYEERKRNGRVEGRNLITWSRKYRVLPYPTPRPTSSSQPPLTQLND